VFGVGAWLLSRDAGAPPASPTIVPLTALPGDESYATLSPDGTQVAFAWSGETRENWDIYVQQIEGIYYLSRSDPKHRTMFEVRFFRFTTQASETLHRFESLGVATITVSPDRKTMLLTGTPVSAGTDLMLTRNFR
jgi:predicted dienelactone hydrolase